MKEINSFSLSDNDDESIERPSPLFYLNEATGLILEGNKIVGQYVADNFYLLVTTEPAHWGEVVNFYLLNLKVELVDRLSLSGDFPYDSFFLSDIEIAGECAIEFFISGIKEKFRLVVLAKPKFNFPNLNPYSIVYRPAFTKQLMTNFELKRIQI
jgi:hypothetical protein